MTALLESLTALLEYLDLLQCLKITVLGHVHLSACNINNSPHKLGLQFSMRAGDQKLRFDLVWPNYTVQSMQLLYISSGFYYVAITHGLVYHHYNRIVLLHVCVSTYSVCAI